MMLTDGALIFSNGSYDNNYYHSHVMTNMLKEFASRHGVELTVKLRLNIKDTIPGALRTIADTLPDSVITPTSSGSFVIANQSVFLSVGLGNEQSPFGVETRTITVIAHGRLRALETFHQTVEKHIRTNDTYVHWWFKAGNDLKSIQFTMQDNREFKPDLYPFIGDADRYISDFIASQASVLILLGEPGTGKTSFIRHILKKSRSECYITYDHAVMNEDGLYINFLSDKWADFLVLEDADLLLCERVRDANKVMSKLLNASDGLIPMNKKKIIFTANITDPSKIDEALVRPGRCYGVLRFRPLTHGEANDISVRYGLSVLPPKPEYTLAEIFNRVA